MMKILIHKTVPSLFILLFLYTGTDKLLNRELFENSLAASLPFKVFAPFLSWAIPLVEILIVFLLFTPRYQQMGLILSGILMLVFTIYIAYMLSFVQRRPCSCGGVISLLSWPQHLVFNIFFLILSATASILRKKIKKQEVSFSGSIC
jgi:hypothetical protein